MTMDFSSSVLDVDLMAVRRNCAYYRRIAGVPLMAVVKADMYGIGAIPVARACAEAGVTAFAVARVDEALALRAAGRSEMILVFCAMDEKEIEAALTADCSLSLFSKEQLVVIRVVAGRLGKAARVHLKIDTGMGRFGFFPEALPNVLFGLRGDPLVTVEGIYSHYANIDDDPDDDFNGIQYRRFEAALSVSEQLGFCPAFVHFSNSAATLNAPRSRYSMVRVGNALIGVNPFYYREAPAEIESVLIWRTKLVSVRFLPKGQGIGYGQRAHLTEDSWVGVVPVGYGDGFIRAEPNEVLIEGARCPVIGSVCTDVSMVLLPHEMTVGTEVILLGASGAERISVADLARRRGTTRAAVTCGITGRVRRNYLD